MTHYPFIIRSTLALMAFSSVSISNPASTEWVNQQIAIAVAGLQAQMNAIPAGAQGIPGSQGPQGPQGESGHYTAGEGLAIHDGVIQSTAVHHVGEHYQGGLVFFVEPSGLHGLIAAEIDASPGISWQNGEGGEKIVNAKGNGLFAGDSNTRLIIAEQTIDYQLGNFAALVASNFTTDSLGNTNCTTADCYGGWYLPSLHELHLMYNNLALNGNSEFSQSLYWSSTEASVTEAWSLDFSSGEKILNDKSIASRVRPIRAF